MLRKSRSRGISLVASAMLLTGAVGAAQAANPNQSYDFRACWDDGTVSGFVGVVGTQTWSALRVTSVSFAFEHAGFGDAFAITPSREGSAQSAWLTPQEAGGDLVGALYARNRIAATGTVREPAGGWDDLPAC